MIDGRPDRSLCSEQIFAAIAALAPPIAVMAPRGLSLLLATGALAVAVMGWLRHRSIPVTRSPASFFLGALGALFNFSALWSASPAISLSKGVPAAATLGAVLILCGAAVGIDPARTNVLRRGFEIGVVLGLTLLGFEIVTGSSLHRWADLRDLASWAEFEKTTASTLPLDRSVSFFSLFLWPASGFFWLINRRGMAIGTAVVGLTCLACGHAATPPLAIAIGVLAAVAVSIRPRLGTRLAGAGVVTCILAAPLIPRYLPAPETAAHEYPSLPSSFVHRLMIWREATKWIYRNPVAGLGFETARTISSPKDEVRTVSMRLPDGTIFRGTSEAMPLHPHNAILQWWLELGFIGAAICAGFVGSVFLALSRLDKFLAALGSGMMVTALGNLAISYGAWQNWWLSALILNGALMVAIVAIAPRAKDISAMEG